MIRFLGLTAVAFVVQLLFDVVVRSPITVDEVVKCAIVAIVLAALATWRWKRNRDTDSSA